MPEESPEELAFRQHLESMESILTSCSDAQLPQGTDYHYYKTFDDFNSSLAKAQGTLLQTLLRFAGTVRQSEGVPATQDPEATHDFVMDTLDAVLDRVDKAADNGYIEIKNFGKAAELRPDQAASAAATTALQVPGQEAEKESNSHRKRDKRKEYFTMTAAAAASQKPQLDFQKRVDNSNTPFEGRLGYWRDLKEGSISVPDNLSSVVDLLDLGPFNDGTPHPLHAVIQTLSYPTHALEASEPIVHKGLEETPLHQVESLEQLEAMAAQLARAKHIAVDLEAHAFRSFQGFTCLMQISDRHADYIVDVFKLWEHVGHVLAPIFADPQIVKVLHGSNWDVLWLQRDFGIYVVNLFDTGQAARVLNFPGLGYAFLLEKFCGVKADKRYQLADWRTRPLPEDMLIYARMDTHYLLYIYDRLKVLLNEANGMADTLERSKNICLTTYSKPQFAESDYLEALNNYKKVPLLSAQQEAVFKALYRWRDSVARERDESFEFVIPKQHLLGMAYQLPKTVKELKASAKGGTASMALGMADELLEVIKEAVEASEASGREDGNSLAVMSQELQPVLAEHSQIPALGLHTGLRPNTVLPVSVGQGSRDADGSAEAGPGSRIQAAGLSVPAAQASPAQLAAEPMPELSPQVQLKPKLLSNALPFRSIPTQTGLAGSKRGVMGSMFGSRPKSTMPPTMPQNLGGTGLLVSMTAPSRPQQLEGCPKRLPYSLAHHHMSGVPAGNTDEDSLKAAALKAGLSLSLRSVPEPATRPDQPEQNEGTDAADFQPVSGAAIREVADALRAESQTANPSRPTAARRVDSPQESLLGDFLPLPLSERYPKYRKRKNTAQNESQPGDEAGEMADSRASQSSSDREGEVEASESGEEAVKAILKATGLESDSDDEVSPAAEVEQPQQARKRQKRLQPLPVSEDRLPSLEDADHIDGVDGDEQPKSQEPFDYSAAHASAPGLKLDFNPAPVRGRGRGARGRRGAGGRGPSTRPAAPSKQPSLYALDESKFMKGGKRSTVMPRSGNRNETFGSK